VEEDLIFGARSTALFQTLLSAGRHSQRKLPDDLFLVVVAITELQRCESQPRIQGHHRADQLQVDSPILQQKVD
jgi:hypothetical protein